MIASPGLRAEENALRPTIRFTGLSKERTTSLREVLDRATKLVSTYAPEEDHLLRWTGARDVLEGKHLGVHFTDSRHFELAPPLDEALGEASDGSILVERKGVGPRLLVVVFLDRLLENHGQGHDLDFARLTMTLAGHFLGPVQNFLHARDLERVATAIGKELVNEESVLYARLKFVVDLMNGPEFREFDEGTKAEFAKWALETKGRCDAALAGRENLQ